MDTSPLNRLPQELRDHIYSFVFDQIREVYLNQPSDGKDLQHPLPRTCRQLRAETFVQSYRELRVHCYCRYAANMLRWPRAIGPTAFGQFRALNGRFLNKRTLRSLHERGRVVGLSDDVEGCPVWDDLAVAGRDIYSEMKDMGIRFTAVELNGYHPLTVWFTMFEKPGPEEGANEQA